MSDSLWPHGLQHARFPRLSPSPGACSNSCPLNQWCHPTISSSFTPFSSCLQSFPASGSFSNQSALRIRWPKYWSFNISPSREYSGLISFRIDWLDLLEVQGTLKSLLQYHNSKVSILHNVYVHQNIRVYTLKYIVSLFVNYSWIKLGGKKSLFLTSQQIKLVLSSASFLASPLYEAFVFLIGTAA